MEPTDREAQSETRCDFISQLYSRRRLNNATGNKRYPRGKLIWRLVSLNLPHCYLSLSLSPSAPQKIAEIEEARLCSIRLARCRSAKATRDREIVP